MEKIKAIYRQYFWLILLVWLALIAAFVYWIAGTYQEIKTENSIKEKQTQANISLNSSTNLNKQAGEVSIERKVEDGLREKVLVPKLEQTRQRSRISKTNLERAQSKYNEKTIPLDSSAADNCERLKRLFPNQEFEYCQN